MKKRVTVKQLQRELRQALSLVDSVQQSRTDMAIELTTERRQLQAEVARLKAGENLKLLAERRAMMSQIGQLVEATSKAVMWVVAKEEL